MRLSILAAALAAAMPFAAAATPVTIGFENLGVADATSQPYAGGSEGGFHIAVTDGPFVATKISVLNSSIAPLVDTYVSLKEGPSDGILTITASGNSPFRFTSIDLFAGDTGAINPVVVTGILTGGGVFVDSFTPTLGAGDTFVASNLLNQDIDSLLIITRAATNLTYFDNIVLDTHPATPIPLPAAAWLLLGGLGALGAVARKRAA